MCEAIYIGSTQQISKKRMDGYFSNLLRLLKNGKKSDSFAAHSKQLFDATAEFTYLRKYMTFKVVKQLNPIVEMGFFMKLTAGWKFCFSQLVHMYPAVLNPSWCDFIY